MAFLVYSYWDQYKKYFLVYKHDTAFCRLVFK